MKISEDYSSWMGSCEEREKKKDFLRVWTKKSGLLGRCESAWGAMTPGGRILPELDSTSRDPEPI